MKTLLLGSDDDRRAALESMLQQRGHAVDAESTAEAAWTTYEREQPDLILFPRLEDMHLAFSRRVRAAPDRSTMMAALVQRRDPGQLEAAHHAGIDDCLQASGSMDELSSQFLFVERRIDKIGERIQTEQALRESEAKARAIVETTVDGVITIDERGQIESFNQAAEAIFGYDAEEVIGKNVKVLMPPPYREEHDGYMRSYRETGRRQIIGIGREVTGKRKDGSTFPMDLAVSEVGLGDRRIFTGIVRDITERRRLEKEILDVTEQERRRIGQDLHDGLGQMLTGIGLLSQNLTRQLEQRDLPEAEDAAEITDLLREADQYARDLARGLTPVDLEASGLVAALQRLVANAERLFDIECVFDEVGSALVHDGTTATHMYRIAQEAVSNAVRHGQADRIKIRLASGVEQIRLRIQDDGVGFSETERNGAGMGVHIMNYRARIVGGTLDITSGSDKGTTVTFTLPHRSAPPDTQTESDARPENETTPSDRHA
jgi:PAS domain S-box-containing protein